MTGIKFFINISFVVIYPFTSEIYPTQLGAKGSGLNNAICRIGGIMMP